MNKYLNKKTEIDGIVFDSKKEAEHYLKLRELEKQGKIKDLELQKEYVLIDKFKLNKKTYRKTSYYADFTYVSTEDNKIHVIDVKSPITRKDKVYKLKKKLMAYKYQIEIEER